MAKPYESGLAGYVHAKADILLIALAGQVEILQAADVEESAREMLLDELCTAIDMGMRMLASATDSPGNRHHRDLIMDEGRRGYRKVVEEWDVHSRVLSLELRTEGEVVADFLKELAPLLEGPRSPNRTLIHELVRSTNRRHPTIRQVGDLVESVSMGEIEWAGFTDRAKAVLEQHGKSSSDVSAD